MCILIVEDEPLTRLLIEDILKEAGFKTIATESAAEASEMLTGYPDCFTCLVTDFNLSLEMTGADLIEHMRHFYPDVPIVLATASPEAVTGAWRREHRVELLLKPFGSAAMLDLVNRLLH